MKLRQVFEAKFYRDQHIRPVLIDDWFVFGKKDEEWYVTDSELWAEWLDIGDPSDMTRTDFEKAVVKILNDYEGKSPSGWQRYIDWFSEFYSNDGGDPQEDYQRSVQELEQLLQQRGSLKEGNLLEVHPFRRRTPRGRPRKHEESHCLRKRPYETIKDARTALLQLWKKGRKERSWYKCEYCKKIHLTSRQPGGIAKT